MKQLLYLLTLLLFCSCHQEQIIPVSINVAFQIEEDNHTSPLSVTIENSTKSADHFLWTFDGGKLATSDKRDPGKVVFTTPGEHQVTLEAWNDGDKTSKTYTVRVDSAVNVYFKWEVDVNNYAPARFNFTNQSIGGTQYTWTFTGGLPATYTGITPPTVTYALPGEYPVVLVVENGSKTFTYSRNITVKESMNASFTILPSFEDADDMEAPLRATFDVHLQGVETFEWQCAGATITNPKQPDAFIYFPREGIYSVYLNVSNGKETKQVLQTITVKANTNLRTHKDVKLGISTAQEGIGSFYSTKLRQVIKSSQVTSENGSLIDIAYVGFNTEFTHNFFVSPTKVGETVLTDVPNTKATKFINKTELGSIALTPAQFNSMTNDNLLKNLPITTANYGDESFALPPLSRVVLFETSDGRKGAILIKEIVKAGKEGSYIIADIKVQKND